MKLFCGLPNETASTIVGILHIVFGTILCAAYGTALRVIWDGRISGNGFLARPEVEQEFILSLGVKDASEDFAKTFIIAFLALSLTKIIQGVCLLLAILKGNATILRTWLAFEVCTFVGRIIIFISYFTLGNCKPSVILVHSLSFCIEFFCVMIVTMLIYDSTFRASVSTTLLKNSHQSPKRITSS